MNDLDNMFPDKSFLSIKDVAKFLEIKDRAVYQMTRRVNPRRRPPRISIGSEIRFPKKLFIMWLIDSELKINEKQ